MRELTSQEIERVSGGLELIDAAMKDLDKVLKTKEDGI